MENPDQWTALTLNANSLSEKLAALNAALVGAVSDVTTLTFLYQTFTDSRMSLQSIAGTEIDTYCSSLAAEGMALQALGITQLVAEFRDRVKNSARNARETAEEAQSAARKNRLDSPESLREMAQEMDHVCNMLQGAINAMSGRETQRAQARTELVTAMSRALAAQEEYAAAPAPSNRPSGPIAKKITMEPSVR